MNNPIFDMEKKKNPLTLWYRKSADKWVEALPLGNGRLGAMVFGGVRRERIQLNEDTLWSGQPYDTNNYKANEYMDQVRDLIFQAKYVEAQNIIEQNMGGPSNQAYKPLADLYLEFTDIAKVEDYKRELDLAQGISRVTYSQGKHGISREAFISSPDQAMVLKITSDKPHKLSLKLALDSLIDHRVSNEGEGCLALEGQCPSDVPEGYRDKVETITYRNDQGIKFAVKMKVVCEGGRTKTSRQSIDIENASTVTIYLTAATSFNSFNKNPVSEGKDYRLICDNILDSIDGQSYKELKQRHLDDYQSLFNRVSIDLGHSGRQVLATDERIEAVKGGGDDPALAALLFQYGRYLLISCSRPGTQAANLQGIWNEEVWPPWNSNYTSNINVEMNYWLAEVCNLAECHEPLFDMIDDLMITGMKTAQIHYKARGWTAHHNVDLWRLSTPSDGSASWACWPMAGAWLSSHLWDHYMFSKDVKFLRERAYPVMKEAALFCLDWLVEYKDGSLVTCPSTSPENVFITPEGEECSVSFASTMDISLIRELFMQCIEASRMLEIDKNLRSELELALSRLPKYKIGRHGQLQEWFFDFDEKEPGHRHLSHLYSLYPGCAIPALEDEKFMDAIRNTLDRRLNHGGGHTGWSCAWLINLWARLGDGGKAHE
ncbi:MAG TPA: glycoside hydrolase family 95 protein, partial [Bacillota bacterium]|nr:glycoside hydrolase family 95 protein [Bacillota bacterium]